MLQTQVLKKSNMEGVAEGKIIKTTKTPNAQEKIPQNPPTDYGSKQEKTKEKGRQIIAI